MGTDLSKLIRAINRVGIQNISLLSRMTGMPIETIRYTVKKRFPNIGLKVSLTLNHQTIGLERYFAVLRFGDAVGGSVPTMMKALSKGAFLTYWSKAAFDPRVIALFSVPVSVAAAFGTFMDRLANEGVLSQYHMTRLDWTRHPELDGRYYEFSSGTWKVDWAKIGSQAEEPPAPVKEDEPPATPDIDAVDVLIIKEMELDAWRNLAEIARKLAINERTARWHYSKHLSSIANSNYVHWFPATPAEVSKAIGAVYEFQTVTKAQVAKLRLLFNNFPFSWFEAGAKEAYYQVHLAMPAGEFMESSRFLSTRLPEIVKRWETYPLDIATERSFTIPYEHFDQKKGWIFDQDKALKAVLPEGVTIKG